MFNMFRMKNSKPADNRIFSVGDLLEATGGELVKGDPEGRFSGVSIDSRTVKDNDIFIAINGERFDGHNFAAEAIEKGAACVIVAKDKAVTLGSRVPCNLISVKDTTESLASLAYYHRKRFDIPVICISGSNGKTTTKEILTGLLSAKYNVLKNEGNQNNAIGLSLNLLNLKATHQIAVLELGTNHFGEIKELTRIASPNVAIITNIGPAHLEFFQDAKGVLKEKWQLIEELSPPCIAILNADDTLLREKMFCQPHDADINIFTFGIKENADFRASSIRCLGRKTHFNIKNKPIVLNTISRVNVYNALAAYAASRIFSIDAFDIIEKFKNMKFPKARFEVKKINGINVIDDAYNANPASFSWALESLKNIRSRGRKIVVMGDMLELGREKETLHRDIGALLSASKVDMIVAVGSLSHIASEAAVKRGFDIKQVYKCLSNKEAKKIISDIARANDTVLLKGSRAMKREDIFY